MIKRYKPKKENITKLKSFLNGKYTKRAANKGNVRGFIKNL
jgi:hypothetical protein